MNLHEVDFWTIDFWTGSEWSRVAGASSRTSAEETLSKYAQTGAGRFRIVNPKGVTVLYRGTVRSQQSEEDMD